MPTDFSCRPFSARRSLRPARRLLVGLAALAISLGAATATVAAADLPGPDDVDHVVPTRASPGETGSPAAPSAAPGSPAAPSGPTVDIEAERRSVQSFGDRNADCLAWGDGCVTCLRGEDGRPVCANPGPACTPRETACTRRRDTAPASTPADAPAPPPAPAPAPADAPARSSDR